MLTVENTWQEIRDAGVDTAVIPFGSIEQHGPHLPIGTDWVIAQSLGQRLAEELDALLLPAMPYGNSREHMAFPGTITLRPGTLAAVLEDIVDSLRSHGIHKIVVLSTHGGNWILKPTLREINYQYPELKIVWANGVVPERGDLPPEEIHAGKSETSTMLHLRPDLVKGDLSALDNPGTVGQEFLDYVGLDKTTRTGIWGVPSQASPDAGRERLRTSARRQAEYVRWVFRKLDQLESKDLEPSAPDQGEGCPDSPPAR